MSQAPGEILYTFRVASKPVLQRGRTNVTQMAGYASGVLAAPSGGTYALYAPRSDLDNATPVASGNVVVTSSIAQFTVQSTALPSTLVLGPGYLEIWDLVMPDGRSYKVRRPVVVGLFQLFPPVTQEDLVQGEYLDLLVSLGSDPVTKLQGFMDASWNHVIRRLEAYGTWADVVVDPSDLFEWHRHETLKRAFGNMLMRQDNERWTELLTYHRDEAKKARQGLRITTDRNRDGVADDVGKEAVIKVAVPNVPPRRRVRRRSKWG